MRKQKIRLRIKIVKTSQGIIFQYDSNQRVKAKKSINVKIDKKGANNKQNTGN